MQVRASTAVAATWSLDIHIYLIRRLDQASLFVLSHNFITYHDYL